MFYIPDDWLKDKDNKSDVYDILKKHIRTDLRDDDALDPIELAIKELDKIGETMVVEKIREGELITSF